MSRVSSAGTESEWSLVGEVGGTAEIHDLPVPSDGKRIKIEFIAINRRSNNSSNSIRCRVNGSSGSNYEYVDVSGTTTTGDSSFLLGNLLDGNASLHGMITVSRTWEVAAALNASVADSGSNFAGVLACGRNDSVASPISSLSIEGSSGSVELSAEVYKR